MKRSGLYKEEGKRRVIWEDEHLFVLAPFASQSPYGAWFIPKRHFRTMAEMNGQEKKSFAKAMKLVLGKLDQIDVPYNYFFHNATESGDYHMHLKLEPRPNVWAGLELGTGIIINPIPPEFAAKFYREDLKLETDARNHIKINL